ncbi:carbon-nitrogen hydrolase [Limtongia smithiae]|uniref:carbon-nitrogen hydrolase n=1 Tax=Limtongia smithiae TaxID=1125753 RepID=UPI0034CDAC77
MPYLEPTANGPTTEWARRTATKLGCHVIVGYPELASAPAASARQDSATENDDVSGSGTIYNAAVVVSPSGEVLCNYRKHFLYEADERWGASPGRDGFACLDLEFSQKTPDKQPESGLADRHTSLKVALGICMDLNPKGFVAPFEKFEFGNFAVAHNADMIVMPMAWLSAEKQDAHDEHREDVPEYRTISYWARRLTPIVRQYLHADLSRRKRTPTIFIAANRCGVEDGDTAYAGSTSAVSFAVDGSAQLVASLNAREEGLLSTTVDYEPSP